MFPFIGQFLINIQTPPLVIENFFPLQFQDTHNQAGIAHNGGLVPLLKLLDSKNGSLQHNAAFALYGLAENEV
jgi:hypothetical protein